jgi:glucokinase
MMPAGDLLLAVDVGGTKIHLALGHFGGGDFLKIREEIAPTAETSDLPRLLAEFAGGERRRIAAAAVGIAGPVVDATVRGANLPWLVEEALLSKALGGVPVRLLNDLVASGYGISALHEDELVVLRRGRSHPGGNRALVSPGTGLGECILVWDGETHHPVASEAGHADFAARTEEEIELLRFLRGRYGRASAERVISGPGLVNVFVWLRESGREADDSEIDASEDDPEFPQEISTRALAGTSRICATALATWSAALGAEAGNIALRGVAVDGVYLGGGIPSKVLPFLQKPEFLEAFNAKFPQEELLQTIPVRVVLSSETTLLGSALAARRLAERRPGRAPAAR